MNLVEPTHIAVSVLAIALALTIAQTQQLPYDFWIFASFFVIFLLTVGIGFILHELAHKYVAIRYGAQATYRAWPFGLGFMLLISIFGMVFAAPGAVYVFSPYLTRRENGIISLAGPMTNLALAFLFYAGAISFGGTLGNILGFGASVNLFLGFFNMLPIPPLDGSKVLSWSFSMWLSFLVAMFGFSIISGVPII
ncbi:MAG: site-2 protease family protein [Candidatus Micrarchaeota archaeon]